MKGAYIMQLAELEKGLEENNGSFSDAVMSNYMLWCHQ